VRYGLGPAHPRSDAPAWRGLGAARTWAPIIALLVLFAAFVPLAAGSAPAGVPPSGVAAPPNRSNGIPPPGISRTLWGVPGNGPDSAPSSGQRFSPSVFTSPTGPIVPSHPALPTRVGGLLGAVGTPSTPNTVCPPLPEGSAFALFRQYDIENAGVNFSFTSTPASSAALAPMTLNWTTTVYRGGLAPYHYDVEIFSTNRSRTVALNSTAANGSYTLELPGLYILEATVMDASCTQWSWGYEYLLVEAPGIGVNPLSVSVHPSSETVPARLNYTATPTAPLPAGWSYLWVDPLGQTNGSGPTVSAFEYFPGVYNDSACLVTNHDQPYACATSPNVTLGGKVPVRYAVEIGSGPYPITVNLSASEIDHASLPIGTELALLTYDATDLAGRANRSSSFGIGIETSESAVALNRSLGCGAPWTPEWVLTPSGTCWNVGIVELLSNNPDFDGGFLGELTFTFNLTAPGNASTWFPTFTASFGPTAGPSPLNFTLNLTGTGGAPPYNYAVLIFGEDFATPGGSFYGSITANGTGWLGLPEDLLFPLSGPGEYLVTILAGDSGESYAIGVLPVITVTPPTPIAPLEIEANETTLGQAPSITNATFVANATGGVGPYTVQWSFGDGSFSSSELGRSVGHSYTAPGTYEPSVSVTDGSGHVETIALPSITVQANTTIGTPHTGGNSPPSSAHATNGFVIAWLPTLIAAAVAVGLVGLALWVRRDAMRAEGEALAAVATPAPDGRPPEEL
jgi:PKD domain